MKIDNKWVVTGEGGYSVAKTELDKYGDKQLLTWGGCGCCGGGPEQAIDDEPVARLMAAAPELLRALRRSVPDHEGVDLLGLLDDIEFTEE